MESVNMPYLLLAGTAPSDRSTYVAFGYTTCGARTENRVERVSGLLSSS
jgi:hypothetical protein